MLTPPLKSSILERDTMIDCCAISNVYFFPTTELKNNELFAKIYSNSRLYPLVIVIVTHLTLMFPFCLFNLTSLHLVSSFTITSTNNESYNDFIIIYSNRIRSIS